jgi:hypothetical protein
MSGGKTRFGFSGDGSEPPDSEEARAARTMLGHDIHLQVPPAAVPPGRPSQANFSAARGLPTPPPRNTSRKTGRKTGPLSRASVPVYQAPEDTAKLPSRRPVRPPTSRLGRFLGRWTKSGRFVSQSQLALDNEKLEVPRDPLARDVLLVVVVALVTFLVTFLVVKGRQHVAAPLPGAASPATDRVPIPSPAARPTEK